MAAQDLVALRSAALHGALVAWGNRHRCWCHKTSAWGMNPVTPVGTCSLPHAWSGSSSAIARSIASASSSSSSSSSARSVNPRLQWRCRGQSGSRGMHPRLGTHRAAHALRSDRCLCPHRTCCIRATLCIGNRTRCKSAGDDDGKKC